MTLRIFLAFSFLLNLALFYSLVGGQHGIIEYKKLDAQNRSLEERIAGLDAQNVYLSREIRLLQTDTRYVEKVIRNRLHYIRDNEIRYIFPDEAELEPLGGSHEAKN